MAKYFMAVMTGIQSALSLSVKAVLLVLYFQTRVTFVCLCRYTTKHLNDETTPKSVKNLLA